MTVIKSKKIPKQKKVKEEIFKCQFCKTEYHREDSLIAHLCEKKRRWFNKDERYVKLGFYAYTRFYQIQFVGKKVPDYENFMNSRHYIGFVKFGRYILNLNAFNPEGFVDFVIKSTTPLKEWCSPHVYELYVREITKKESPSTAIERNILLMQQWSQETGEPWTDFFRKINTNIAVMWIKSGRISPWIIYTADSVENLFSRMSSEQLALIHEYVDPSCWKAKLKMNKEDVAFLKKELKVVGL
jgi:hypothetical protein